MELRKAYIRFLTKLRFILWNEKVRTIEVYLRNKKENYSNLHNYDFKCEYIHVLNESFIEIIVFSDDEIVLMTQQRLRDIEGTIKKANEFVFLLGEANDKLETNQTTIGTVS